MAKRIAKTIIYGLIFLLLFFVLSTVFGAFDLKYALTIEYSAEQADRFQVFYRTSQSETYTEEESVEAAIIPGVAFTTADIELPEGFSTDSVRLDIGDISGNVISIRKVSVFSGHNFYQFNAEEITRLLELGNIIPMNISLITGDTEKAVFENLNNDGSLEFFPEQTRTPQPTFLRRDNLVRFGLSFLAALLLTFIIYRHVYLHDLIDVLLDLRKNRRIIASMALNDFKSRYAGSYLGMIWAFVQPLCTILIYWFVFEVGLRASSMSEVPYSLWLTAGLVPWFFFSEAWFGMSCVFQDYSYLVKKVMFDLDTMPFIRLLSSLITHGAFILIMMAVYMAYGYYPSIWTFQLLYYVIALCCWLIAISFITASVMVFIRDIGQVMNIVVQFGMWLTPILWNINIFPKQYEIIFKLNPIYYIVQGFRNCMLADKFILFDNIKWMLYFWTLTAVVLCVGMSMFRKLKVHFADVL